MRITTVFFCLLLPGVLHAQAGPQMNQEQMMQKMQAMQACMDAIDPAQMKAVEEQGYKVEAEIKSLCASGKRDAAHKQAAKFARGLKTQPAILEMRRCTEMMQGMMPGMMPQMMNFDPATESSRHVCDQ